MTTIRQLRTRLTIRRRTRRVTREDKAEEPKEGAVPQLPVEEKARV